jgi:fumarate reductase subunit D
MKREAIKAFGEVPMILLIFFISIASGAFSSLYIAPAMDLSIKTGIHLPWMIINRDFMVAFFCSCMAIASFLLGLIVLILYNAAHRIEIEDEKEKKRGHARTRRY